MLRPDAGVSASLWAAAGPHITPGSSVRLPATSSLSQGRGRLLQLMCPRPERRRRGPRWPGPRAPTGGRLQPYPGLGNAERGLLGWRKEGRKHTEEASVQLGLSLGWPLAARGVVTTYPASVVTSPTRHGWGFSLFLISAEISRRRGTVGNKNSGAILLIAVDLKAFLCDDGRRLRDMGKNRCRKIRRCAIPIPRAGSFLYLDLSQSFLQLHLSTTCHVSSPNLSLTPAPIASTLSRTSPQTPQMQHPTRIQSLPPRTAPLPMFPVSSK